MTDTSINNFFGITAGGFWQEILAGQTGVEIVAALKSQALARVAPDQWPRVISGIADKAKELFDVDIAWVIVSGWGKSRELMENAGADRRNPRDIHLVPLGKHTMSVDYNPFLQVMFNGQVLGQIVFDVKLSFEMEGFVLTIQNSKIMKLRTGSCSGKGRIEFKGDCLVEKTLTKITFPGILDLGEGIALPRGDE